MGRKSTNTKKKNKNRHRSKAQKVRRIAEKIRDRKLPIIDRKTGEEHMLLEGEEMVRCYDFKTFKEHKYHFVTSFGRTITILSGTPYFLKQSPNNEGYLQFGYWTYVHRAVWFSFAYDAIKNKKEMPDNYKLPKGISSSKTNLRKIAEESRTYVVHHKDKNPQNNHITNLECCFISSHSMLHKFEDLQGTTDDETDRMRLEYLYQRKDITEPSIISSDSSLSITELSPESVRRLQNSIELRAHMITEWVFKVYGAEYFQKDRICVIDDGSMIHCFDVRDGVPTKSSTVPVPLPEPDILYEIPSDRISVSLRR